MISYLFKFTWALIYLLNFYVYSLGLIQPQPLYIINAEALRTGKYQLALFWGHWIRLFIYVFNGLFPGNLCSYFPYILVLDVSLALITLFQLKNNTRNVEKQVFTIFLKPLLLSYFSMPLTALSSWQRQERLSAGCGTLGHVKVTGLCTVSQTHC